jgi:hypothetical protein
MEVKYMANLILKRKQKIVPAKKGIVQYMSPECAIYKIGLNQHIGDLILVESYNYRWIFLAFQRSGISFGAYKEH